MRNGGLLLFQAVTDFLFPPETKYQAERGWDGNGAKIQYEKYPGLLALLLNMLENFTEGDVPEKPDLEAAIEEIIPALNIVRRVGLPEEYQHGMNNPVLIHLSSKVWLVRKLAAQVICSLTPIDDWEPAVVELLAQRRHLANFDHGVLLAVKLIMERESELENPSTSTGKVPILFTIFHD